MSNKYAKLLKLSIIPFVVVIELFLATKVSLSDTNAPDSITLSGTLRDFKDSHPDFERDPGDISADGSIFRYGNDQGITTDTLGADQKPVYAGGSFSTTTKANFDQWYNDVDGVNQSIVFPITLTRQEEDGLYQYQNTDFFPLDNQLFGNYGIHNYHFTYELKTTSTYQGGEIFQFSGDDDVWVYINGHKVIDIGGVHSRQDVAVNLDDIADDIGLKIGEDYVLNFFFAERHTSQSNFIITTNIKFDELSFAD